jgi:protein tyrosine/serine phosphatase
MKSLIPYFSLVFIIAYSASGFAYARQSAATEDLPNFYQVNANFYRGAQPTENGVRLLAERGVKTIIDLRGEDEKSKTEEIWVRNNGIRFINVGLKNWLEPKTEDIERIIKMVETPENQPVFVHCRRGADRTGTVVAVYRIAHDGWTAKQATIEAKKFGFGWWQFWMKDFINDYYSDFLKRK